MTELEIIRWAFLLVIGVLGYLMKRNIESAEARITKLETDMDNFRANYLHKDDFREFKQELRDMIDEIRKDIHALRNNRNG